MHSEPPLCPPPPPYWSRCWPSAPTQARTRTPSARRDGIAPRATSVCPSENLFRLVSKTRYHSISLFPQNLICQEQATFLAAQLAGHTLQGTIEFCRDQLQTSRVTSRLQKPARCFLCSMNVCWCKKQVFQTERDDLATWGRPRPLSHRQGRFWKADFRQVAKTSRNVSSELSGQGGVFVLRGPPPAKRTTLLLE